MTSTFLNIENGGNHSFANCESIIISSIYYIKYLLYQIEQKKEESVFFIRGNQEVVAERDHIDA